MLQNYLKIARRNLFKNKVYSFINIVGLSTAIICILLALLFWNNEHNFDTFHENNPNLYRIVTTVSQNDGDKPKIIGGTGQVQGVAFKNAVPEIETYTRVMGGGIYNDVTANENTFALQSLFVDSTFFDVFTFQFVEGNKSTAFERLNSVVITESTAKKYFNRTDVIGELLSMDTDPSFQRLGEPLVVSAVVADLPANSSVQFDALFTFDFLGLSWIDTNWLNAYLGTFVVLQPNADLTSVTNKFDRVFASLAKEQLVQSQSEYGFAPSISYSLQSMADVHLYPLSRDGGGTEESGVVNASNPIYSYVLIIIAAFILLMAGINFINISIANSLKRAKEVGVRKVSGGSKIDIAKHFITEAFLVCGVSFLVAVAGLYFVFPFVNELLDKQLIVHNLLIVNFLISVFAAFVLLLLLTSAYPAFVLSNLNPAEVLYNKQKSMRLGIFNKGLVVVQFGLGVFLLVTTLTYYFQMDFVQTKDLGYNPSQVVRVEMRGNLDYAKISDFLKSELNRQPFIKSSSVSQTGRMDKASFEGKQIDVHQQKVDEGYLETLNIELLLGEGFSKERILNYKEGIVVNQAFVKSLNITNPVGQQISMDEKYDPKKKTIIGVVKDFHFGSLRESIQPLVMFTVETPTGYLFVNYEQAKQQEAIASIEKTYASAVPAGIFEYRFMNDLNAKHYQKEQQMQSVINVATLLSFIICCLGLFGLTHLSTNQRVKEIGLRKVLGASVSEIVQLLSIDFLKLIVLSFFISVPVAWYFMREWLSDFAYRIDNTLQIVTLACITALIISFLTISYQAIKAALANPVESLRSE
jgi:putative ABC transport system permease protein